MALITEPVWAQDQEEASDTLPAVSAPNVKAAVNGGTVDSRELFFVDASVSLPVLDQYGLQLDGIAGTLDSDGFAGGAAHLFWRDPDIALVGLYGSTLFNTAGRNTTISNTGVTGALYLGMFSIEGTVGAQFSNRRDTDIFASTNLAVYPVDDLRLYGGYRHGFGQGAAAAGFEWQLPGNDNSLGFSFFADSRFREDDVMAFGGVRVYFGENKTLIRRHREDDPSLLMPDDVFLIDGILNGAPAAGQQPPGEPDMCQGEWSQEYYEYCMYMIRDGMGPNGPGTIETVQPQT